MPYLSPVKGNWSGRKTDPNAAPDYWYQVVRMLDLDGPEADLPYPDFAFLGYACEEGVQRNQGRLGAAAGAMEVIKKLGSLANHLGDKTIADAGSVTCENDQLEATQLAFGNRIHQLLSRGTTPIGLGGGHDIAYAHFLGIHQFLNGPANPKGNRLGILNFDAHFDLRPFPDGSTSGTPFRQILTFHGDTVTYLPVGIQPDANPPSLFEAAANLGVDCITADACTPTNVPTILHMLQGFLERVDHVYVTVDLDGFSSAYAPGVSAPSPVGFSPEFFFPIFRRILASGKVLTVDIAELSPAFDQDGITAKLAARIVAEVVRSKINS